MHGAKVKKETLCCTHEDLQQFLNKTNLNV